jgi:hypothetical protein
MFPPCKGEAGLSLPVNGYERWLAGYLSIWVKDLWWPMILRGASPDDAALPHKGRRNALVDAPRGQI